MMKTTSCVTLRSLLPLAFLSLCGCLSAQSTVSGSLVAELQRAASSAVSAYELRVAQRQGGDEPLVIHKAEPDALVDNFIYFKRQPEFNRCQELLQKHPALFIKCFDVLSTNTQQMVIFILAADGLSADDYADFLLRCLELGKAGKMTADQWRWAMSGHENNFNILMHNYAHPKVIKICQTAPLVFKDPDLGEGYYKGILSGEIFKRYWETVEDLEGRKPTKVPKLKATQ